MAFVMCDDHNLSVEADGMDVATAKQTMLGEPKPNPTAIQLLIETRSFRIGADRTVVKIGQAKMITVTSISGINFKD